MYDIFLSQLRKCADADAAKSLYRELARQHHPDFGGELETMKALNAAYGEYVSHYAKVSAQERQEQAHKENRKSAADYHDMDGLAAEIKQTIEAVLNSVPLDVELELCGLWLWATGNTKPVKDILKCLGFKWSNPKQAWYKAFVPSFNRQKRSLDEIRQMHGSTRFSRAADDEDQPRPTHHAPLPA